MGRSRGPTVKVVRALIGVAIALASSSCTGSRGGTFVACADPNNMPFSNRAGEGFENKLAEMIAADLGAKLEYVWWAQRRGYVRNTLNEAKCDFWPGVASTLEMLETSRPYYRSTYMFVTRRDAGLSGLTLNDPHLKKLRIGVQMVGDDASNTPPAHALARRGIIGNMKGYMLYGDYSKPNPPAEVMRAVERGDVDVAVVWGPLAGYFASKSTVPLRLDPVTPWFDDARWPMQFDISVGVRKGEAKLQKQIDDVLARRAPQIRTLLDGYHVPQVAS